jgi:hypothetical protein
MKITIESTPGWEDLERRIVVMMSKNVPSKEDLTYLLNYGFHPNDVRDAIVNFHREVNKIAEHINL